MSKLFTSITMDLVPNQHSQLILLWTLRIHDLFVVDNSTSETRSEVLILKMESVKKS